MNSGHPKKEQGRAKRIALLRANPKDAWIGKLTAILTKEFEVACYIWDRQADFAPHLSNDRAHYHLCKVRAGFYDLSTVLKLLLFETWLLARLLFGRYDAIHAIDLDTGLVGLVAARLRRKHFVYHCLDPYYAALPPTWPAWIGLLARRLENRVITHADIFLVTDMLRLPQHEGAQPRAVVEIANIPFIEPPGPKHRDRETFVVGYIGSLVEGRNLGTIIEAVGGLAGEGVELVVGGFGPLEDSVRSAAASYPNVSYSGWMPYERVMQAERGFDLFVHITDTMNESQRWVSPNKLFESMAFSVPILVGEGTVAAAHVREIGNGLVVPYGSVEAVRDALLRLKGDPSLCAEMGGRGRRALDETWDRETIESRLLDLYRSPERMERRL